MSARVLPMLESYSAVCKYPDLLQKVKGLETMGHVLDLVLKSTTKLLVSAQNVVMEQLQAFIVEVFSMHGFDNDLQMDVNHHCTPSLSV